MKRTIKVTWADIHPDDQDFVSPNILAAMMERDPDVRARVEQQRRERVERPGYKNPDNDPRGPWREGSYLSGRSFAEKPSLYYPITHPVTGEEVLPPVTSIWRYSAAHHEEHVAEGLLWWGKTGNYRWPKVKRFD